MKNIDLTSWKPISNNFDKNDVRIILDEIWEYIENNYDKKVERVIVIGTDAQFYISYPLDDSQMERLQNRFYGLIAISEIESYDKFVLISFDI